MFSVKREISGPNRRMPSSRNGLTIAGRVRLLTDRFEVTVPLTYCMNCLIHECFITPARVLNGFKNATDKV
jgi:hypothetical protein